MEKPKPYYEHGGITIYHGDCREILPILSGVDAVFTSPPYNRGLRSDRRTGWEGVKNKSAKDVRFRAGYGGTSDALPMDEYIEVTRDAIRLAWLALSDDGALWLNHKPRLWGKGARLWSPTVVLPDEVSLRQIIAWNCGGGIDVSERGYSTCFEWVMFCPKDDFKMPRSVSGRGDVWNIPRDREVDRNCHPAPFPAALPARAMEALNPGAVVLDPFLGSGSTLIAARSASMRAIGIEIEERYCEIAAKRLAQEVLPFE